MPQGLEIYRPDGSIRATYSDRLSRVVGIVTLNNVAGSVTVDATKGTPWAALIRQGLGIYGAVSITTAGGVGTISYPAVNGGYLVYGVY